MINQQKDLECVSEPVTVETERRGREAANASTGLPRKTV